MRKEDKVVNFFLILIIAGVFALVFVALPVSLLKYGDETSLAPPWNPSKGNVGGRVIPGDIQKFSCEAKLYRDGDSYIGENQQNPNYRWKLANLLSNQETNIPEPEYDTWGGPILSVYNNFVDDNFADNPPGEGEGWNLPHNYGGIYFEDLIEEDFEQEIEIELNSDDLTEQVSYFDGVLYEVELVSASDNAATIRVTNLDTGEYQQKEIAEGDAKEILDLTVFVVEADETNMYLSVTLVVSKAYQLYLPVAIEYKENVDTTRARDSTPQEYREYLKRNAKTAHIVSDLGNTFCLRNEVNEELSLRADESHKFDCFLIRLDDVFPSESIQVSISRDSHSYPIDEGATVIVNGIEVTNVDTTWDEDRENRRAIIKVSSPEDTIMNEIWIQTYKNEHGSESQLLFYEKNNEMLFFGNADPFNGGHSISIKYGNTEGQDIVLNSFTTSEDENLLGIRFYNFLKDDNTFRDFLSEFDVFFSLNSSDFTLNALGDLKNVAEEREILYAHRESARSPVNLGLIDKNLRDEYGTKLMNPFENGALDKAIFYIPSDRVYSRIDNVIGPRSRIYSNLLNHPLSNLTWQFQGSEMPDITFNGRIYKVHEEMDLSLDDPSVETSLTSKISEDYVNEEYAENVYMETLANKIKYAHAFDDAIDLSAVSEDNPLVISFLGQCLKIVGVPSDSEILVKPCTCGNGGGGDGFHSGCYGNYCVSLPGEGQDECLNNYNCGEWHTECGRNEWNRPACMLVQGYGDDECRLDKECIDSSGENNGDPI